MITSPTPRSHTPTPPMGAPERRRTSPQVIPANGGFSFSVMGIEITPKVRGEDCDGAYVMLEQVVPPGAGTPPHVCHDGQKTIYVVDGTFQVLLGEITYRLTAGGCALIPKGTAHSFHNVGSRAGRLLVTLAPAGHERFLEELSRLGANGEPDPKRFAELCDAHGVELIDS